MSKLLLSGLDLAAATFGAVALIAVVWWAWPRPAAEAVYAVYYPRAGNLLVDVRSGPLATVAACRAWVASEADVNGDPGMTLGDYECGVGLIGPAGNGANIYRETVR